MRLKQVKNMSVMFSMIQRPDCHTEPRQCGQHNNISPKLAPLHNSLGGKGVLMCRISQKYYFDEEQWYGCYELFFLDVGYMSCLMTKPTEWPGTRRKESDQPGHPPSLIRVFAVRMTTSWVLSFPLSTQQRLWSDWVDAQADLSLRLVHSHFVGFVTPWENLLCNMRTTKAQISAHPRSLISAFVVPCLDSIISVVSISEISNLCLANVAAEAGLSLPW